MGTLYIVATPIGNLEDFTFRALKILKEADLILCEDTRETRKLLENYDIQTKTISYHQHSKIFKLDYILSLLKSGKNLALVSDSGTPGISDPGNELISYLTKELGDTFKIIPIPGASAATAAASICGFPMNKFLFFGFPPAKNKRKKFFEIIAKSEYPSIFYESPYRIDRSLRELKNALDGEGVKDRGIFVARELTKKFEETYRGRIEDVLKTLEREGPKGEFVIVVGAR